MAVKFFDSITMLIFVKIKVPKEEFYGSKKPIKIWDVNVDNTVYIFNTSFYLKTN